MLKSGSMSLITCAIGSLYMNIASCDDLYDSKKVAEQQIVSALCTSTPSELAVKSLGKINYLSEEGLNCSGKLISQLTMSAIATDTYILSVSEHLWNLVDNALANPSANDRLTKLLQPISLDLNHPLRSEAWLALQFLKKNDNTLQYIKGKAPYIYIPNTHTANLFGADILNQNAASLEARLISVHPTLRRALAWAYSQLSRERISNAEVDKSSLVSVLYLSQALSQYGMTSDDFIEEFIDGFFSDNTLITTLAEERTEGQDNLQNMSYTLSGTVCAAESSCKSLDTNTTGITNYRVDATRGYDPDPSWSTVSIPYIISGGRENTLANYSASIMSNIRGGYWTKKTLGVVTKTGDGTSTADYSLTGNATIPKCNDPGKCSVKVILRSRISETSASYGISSSLSIEGPTGKIELPVINNGIEIDRSAGDHKISLVLRRKSQHTGGCCNEWIGQFFDLEILKPGVPMPFLTLNSSEGSITRFSPPSWLDKKLIEDLFAFESLNIQLGRKLDLEEADLSVYFANTLGGFSKSYNRRYSAMWSRLLFTRLGLEWGSANLSASEKNELYALNNSISQSARALLQQPLQNELELYKYIQESLDTTPILLVMSALVRDTDLTDPLNIAEAKIVAQIAESKSTETTEQLNKAKKALDFVRAGSPRVNALLRLTEAEYSLNLRKLEIQRRYERIGRELAQLSKQR